MALKRYLTEMGMGVDVHGGDYTKAAKRAVSDAIRHSSINFFPHIGYTKDDMQLHVKIAAQKPELIDKEAVAAEFPYGCLLYTSPSPRDQRGSRMPSSA